MSQTTVEVEKKYRAEWLPKIQGYDSLEKLTDALVDWRLNSRPPKERSGNYRWVEAKMEEHLAKLKAEKMASGDLLTKTTRGEALDPVRDSYIKSANESDDIIQLEKVVDEFRENYRPPIMPVHDYLQIERELCEVLLRYRGERWWDMDVEELRKYRGAKMVKADGQFAHSLMVLYPKPKNAAAFDKAYMEEHVPLAEKLGAKSFCVNKVLSTIPRGLAKPVLGALMKSRLVPDSVISFLFPYIDLIRTISGEGAAYYQTAELHFDDLTSLEAAAGSSAAKEAVGHAMEISTGGAPSLMILESDLALDEVAGKVRPPVKLTICFPRQPDVDAFEDVWVHEIIPMALQIPCESLKAYKVIGTADGSPAPFHRVAELYYNDQEQMKATICTQKIRDAVAQILAMSPVPLVIISESA
jgi:methane monooxygenase component A gamma chain